ncbi:MAG: cytochrome c peroxidase [Saprospiraceae bacterium]
MRYWIFSFALILYAAGYVSDIFFVPDHWPPVVYDYSKNQMTPSKVDLGRVLFYDPLLSKDYSISCASCHSPFSAFAHTDHDLSHGIFDSIGTRNAPALMNLAWQSSFMWDGAIHHLDMQALAPITHPSEMGSSIDTVVNRLNKLSKYHQLFDKAYGNPEATGEKTLKAISQFMLTLVSANSKYDLVMAQKDTFTLQESNGYTLFKRNCASCHAEPLFTTHQFANNGLPIDSSLRDMGRYNITLDSSDAYKFKIPTLRNIEYTYPYMHDGRFKKLSQVLRHYTSGLEQSNTISDPLKQTIILSSNEQVDIIAFLLTLSDKEFVFNKKFQYPHELMK